MPTIWLLRHAESNSNAGHATADPAQIALSARGQEQAKVLAQGFSERPVLIVSSPFLRAQQTGQPLRDRFHESPYEVWDVQEFTYLARFRGIPTTALERRAAVDAYWQQADPWYSDGPGAESFADFIQRAQRTVDKLRQGGDGLIALITHEHFIRAIYWALLSGSFAVSPERMREFYSFKTWFSLPNAAIAKLLLGAGAQEWLSPVSTAHLPPDLIS